MPPVGFQTTVPVFQQQKTLCALDRMAALMGGSTFLKYDFLFCSLFNDAVNSSN
jgi:hypothetical protein